MELFTGGCITFVQEAPNPVFLRQLHKKRGVFDVEYLLFFGLRNIERELKYCHVGLADVDVAGGDKGIDEVTQFKGCDPVGV